MGYYGSKPKSTTSLDATIDSWSGQENPKDKNFKNADNPPKGFAKWSLRLLADKMVELKYVESISHVAVRSVLKKMNLSPGK